MCNCLERLRENACDRTFRASVQINTSVNYLDKNKHISNLPRRRIQKTPLLSCWPALSRISLHDYPGLFSVP